MNKRDMISLAIFGITAGLLTSCEQKDSHDPSNRPHHQLEAADYMTPEMQQFYITLTPETQKLFKRIDTQHKLIAMQLASQSCYGLNICRGLGGCATNSHDCAGQNDCEGLGGNPLNDPNRAVALAAQKQREKREYLNNQFRKFPRAEPSPDGSG